MGNSNQLKNSFKGHVSSAKDAFGDKKTWRFDPALVGAIKQQQGAYKNDSAIVNGTQEAAAAEAANSANLAAMRQQFAGGPAWMGGAAQPADGGPAWMRGAQQPAQPQNSFLAPQQQFMGQTPFGNINAQLARMQSMQMPLPQGLQRFLPPGAMPAPMNFQQAPQAQMPVGMDPRQLPPVPGVGLPMLPNGGQVPGKLQAGQTPGINPFPFGNRAFM